MLTANEITVSGQDFSEAIRQILPTGRKAGKSDKGEVAIMEISPGILRLTSFHATMEMPGDGTWTDSVAVSGLFLWQLAAKSPPSVFHLVFFDGTLMVNGTSVTARTISQSQEIRKPRYVPTNRPGR